ncbi:MAG: anaerobic ribonucleoside-triphosphate reductase activating protein [Alphaproteobacteria bacterium]|nr:anaerobic ribonucleoside-triphosphate reductase activating protein [Alphaproteobacteria bacterium]
MWSALEAPPREEPLAYRRQVLPVYAITPFSMLDFPDRIACIVWFSGCNMRCSYCHNPQIVRSKGKKDERAVFSFLEKRQGLLDGVVLSGGEATSYPGVIDFAFQIKNMGFALKLDTNGLRPDVIERFLEGKLLDYVALDYKASPGKFKTVTGVDKYSAFERSLEMLLSQSQVPFEVRTTVHTTFLYENDVADIIEDLDKRGYSGHYYLQNFCYDNHRPTLGFLEAQERILNTQELPEPHNYSVLLRNF